MRSLRAPLIALGFLTVLPIPVGTDNRDMAAALPWFSSVGLLLGAVLAAIDALARPALGETIVAALLVALLAVLTGGLHLDGLADTVDGLSGGQGDPARTLAIMRDGRIGAHGATALVVILLLKFAGLAAHAEDGRVALLTAWPAVARGAVVPAIAWFPYAHAEGMGRAFRPAHPIASGLGAMATTASILVVTALAGGGMPTIVAGLATVTLVLALGRLAARRIGGLTGDLYGALIELGELTFLLGAVGLHAALG